MSRVGRKPVALVEGVKAEVIEGLVKIAGPKGTLEFRLPAGVTVQLEENNLMVSRDSDEPKQRSLHGMTRSLIANMVEGVSKGFERRLSINGVGYNAKLQGKQLVLNLGFATPVVVNIPEYLQIEAPNPTLIAIKGIDKQKVGQFAAAIRAIKPPEPYNAKGISYEGEIIRRKAGKTFGTGTE